jgi:hypothetical protein
MNRKDKRLAAGMLLSVSTIGALLLAAPAQAQMMQDHQMHQMMMQPTGQTVAPTGQTTSPAGLSGTIQTQQLGNVPMNVQRVDINQTGNYDILGDVSETLLDETQTVAGADDRIDHQVIMVSPNNQIRVYTGGGALQPQPVAQTITTYPGNRIDAYSDAVVGYDINQAYGFTAAGYRPYPQTPDITVNPVGRTVIVDNHLN